MTNYWYDELMATYRWVLFSHHRDYAKTHKYISMDKNGAVWVWSQKPTLDYDDNIWQNENNDPINRLVVSSFEAIINNVPGWEYTLFEIKDIL